MRKNAFCGIQGFTSHDGIFKRSECHTCRYTVIPSQVESLASTVSRKGYLSTSIPLLNTNPRAGRFSPIRFTSRLILVSTSTKERNTKEVERRRSKFLVLSYIFLDAEGNLLVTTLFCRNPVSTSRTLAEPRQGPTNDQDDLPRWGPSQTPVAGHDHGFKTGPSPRSALSESVMVILFMSSRRGTRHTR